MAAIFKSVLRIPTFCCCPCFGRRKKLLVDIPKKETYLGKLVDGLCCQDEENVPGARRRYDSKFVSPHPLSAFFLNISRGNLTKSQDSIIVHAPPSLTIFCI